MKLSLFLLLLTACAKPPQNDSSDPIAVIQPPICDDQYDEGYSDGYAAALTAIVQPSNPANPGKKKGHTK